MITHIFILSKISIFTTILKSTNVNKINFTFHLIAKYFFIFSISVNKLLNVFIKFLSLEIYCSIKYNFNESKKLENNSINIVERFEKVKLEIDQSIKNFEVKIAEMISNKKLNDEQKHDIQKLGTIIKQVDDNLINLKDMLK